MLSNIFPHACSGIALRPPMDSRRAFGVLHFTLHRGSRRGQCQLWDGTLYKSEWRNGWCVVLCKMLPACVRIWLTRLFRAVEWNSFIFFPRNFQSHFCKVLFFLNVSSHSLGCNCDHCGCVGCQGFAGFPGSNVECVGFQASILIPIGLLPTQPRRQCPQSWQWGRLWYVWLRL